MFLYQENTPVEKINWIVCCCSWHWSGPKAYTDSLRAYYSGYLSGNDQAQMVKAVQRTAKDLQKQFQQIIQYNY